MVFVVITFSIGVIFFLFSKNKLILYHLYKGIISVIMSLVFLLVSIDEICPYSNLSVKFLTIIYVTIYILFFTFPTIINAYLLKNGYYYKYFKKSFKIYKIWFITASIIILCLITYYFRDTLGVSIIMLYFSMLFELNSHGIYKYIVLKKLNVKPYLEVYKTKKIDDKDAQIMINEVFKNIEVDGFENIKVSILYEHFDELRKKGMSMKQISRLTGLSYYRVKKICNLTIFDLDDNIEV